MADEHRSGDVDEAARARQVARVSTEYFIRTLGMITALARGELITGLVSAAIVQGNVAHLEEGEGAGGAYAGIDQIPPDSMRRPVSVLAVSSSLGIPYETTRRHVGKLIAAGLCVRVKGGLIVPARTLASPRREAVMRANMGNLRRLFRSLKKAGVEFD